MKKCGIPYVDNTVAIMSLAQKKTIIGRTRLQKLFYLLELADEGIGFDFTYKYYGPYCEKLSNAVDVACAFGLVTEERKLADWGGVYSIFTISGDVEAGNDNSEGRRQLVQLCTKDETGSIPLELAATAAYLSYNKEENPWQRVERLKWDKASKIPQAKELYAEIYKIKTKEPFGAIPD